MRVCDNQSLNNDVTMDSKETSIMLEPLTRASFQSSLFTIHDVTIVPTIKIILSFLWVLQFKKILL